MNAITRFVTDSALPGWTMTPANAHDSVGGASALQGGVTFSAENSRGRRPSGQIPIFRGGKPCGFIDRSDDPSVREAFACAAHSGLPRDVWIRLRLTDLIRRVSGIDTDYAGLAVEKGVVHLSGQADGVHDVLALRRIAAAIPGATAIIDDLWVPCE